jgi:hypothetical protein
MANKKIDLSKIPEPNNTDISKYIYEEFIKKNVLAERPKKKERMRWIFIGISVIFVILILPQAFIYFSVPIITGLLGKPFTVPLLFTFIIISSIFIFTRWRRIEYYLDEWKPDDINPIGLISLHATVIIGVLFFLMLL